MKKTEPRRLSFAVKLLLAVLVFLLLAVLVWVYFESRLKMLK
ncbi:MAG: hypothetical protein ABIY51_14915 [Ferruginibacter sp.]